MKKLSLFCFSIAFSFISLYGQVDKKDPLVVINGKISNIQLNTLDPNNIESMSVSKSQSLKEDYGVLAENGVISIITKDNLMTDDQDDQSGKPLVLVDGKVFTNSLDSINVQEVESMTVLKEISATKLYGKAGRNGVILITLKEKTNNLK
jgi:bla regulator protein blaR1